MSKFVDILDSTTFQSELVQYSTTYNFKDIVRGAVQNETWRDTSSDTLWNIFDACGKDINNIVADGAINYVRNISDINTCRIPALASMGHMLSRDLGGLLELYKMFPTKLQLLVDIFSIDREYLFSGDNQILSISLIRELMQRMKDSLLAILPNKRTAYETIAIEDIFTEFSKNSHALDDKTYRKFIGSIFKRFIADVLSATYSPSDDTKIVDNLLYSELNKYKEFNIIPSSTIIDDVISLRSRHPLDLESTSGTNIPMDDIQANTSYDSLGKQVRAIQESLNISKSFDPWETADIIEAHGFSPTNALTPNEKMLVEVILNAHNKERFDYSKGIYLVDKIDTRYAYYREKEFINYIRTFIYIYDTNINSIVIDPLFNVHLGQIHTDNENINSLSFFNYVDTEWVYSDKTNPEVNDRGTNKYVGREIVGERDIAPTFIPRINEDDFYVNEDYRMDAGNGRVRVDHLEKDKPEDVIDKICLKLVSLVESIHFIRNQLKRQAQFNSMRGTGSLLAHAINDYLLTAFPVDEFVDETAVDSKGNSTVEENSIIPRWAARKAYDPIIKSYKFDISKIAQKEADIAENIRLFRNYTNVRIVEYMDTTEYFNIQPVSNDAIDELSLSKRYWEVNLQGITKRDEPQVGVFSADEIDTFYRDTLSMGMLNKSTSVRHDIEEFLISLYESGATDVTFNSETGLENHPINDSANPDTLFAYSNGSDREKVQDNSELQYKQDSQFLRYTGNTNLSEEAKKRYENYSDLINSYNWKNSKYSSVMLHPFLYTFKLWNPLVNIIINAFSTYSSIDLEKSLTNKYIFDELYGIEGETLNFWKYNILDYSGYVTRYEHEKHSAIDSSNEISPLTGYDGIFYPSAIQRFIDAYNVSYDFHQLKPNGGILYPSRKNWFVPGRNIDLDEYGIFYRDINDKLTQAEMYANMGVDNKESFEQVIASIYWQIEFWHSNINEALGETPVSRINAPLGVPDNRQYRTFYGQYYSHLGYSSYRLRRLAKQLWYWRERIIDAATHRYQVCNYNLDLANNSFLLMDTFNDEDYPDKQHGNMAIQSLDFNIAAANARAMETISHNNNTSAGYCMVDNERPKELWVRWNAEPIAMPAFDVYWNNDELIEREKEILGNETRHEEFGQIQYKNSDTNDVFNDIIDRFIDNYTINIDKSDMSGNKIPIFYSFQQNADYMVFATWDKRKDDSIFTNVDRTHLTPIHVLCKEEQKYSNETLSTTYILSPFADDLRYIDMVAEPGEGDTAYLSAPYVISSARGSIFIPCYRFYAPAPGGSSIHEERDDEENSYVLQNQAIEVKLNECICQVVNTSNFENTKKFISYDKKRIHLNQPWLFGGTVLIARNTNAIFSICDDINHQTASLGIAFLGNIAVRTREQLSKNSVGGCTRYTADSDPAAAIALLRKKFYKAWDKDTNDYLYSDARIFDWDEKTGETKSLWNSFDRNDKYVCVIKFEKDLTETLWNMYDPEQQDIFSSRLLNIISDSSYIPNFAYQSPLNYERFPEISGINRLFESRYLRTKDHWSTQILGLENNLLLDYTKIAQELIIHDETDNADTYVSSGQITDAIYRIWEQSELSSGDGWIDKIYNPQMQLQNPVDITGEESETGKVAIWTEEWNLTELGKDEFLDRYLTIVRCDSADKSSDGARILNQKNWVFKTKRIGDILGNVSLQDKDDYIDLSLDKFYSAAISKDGMGYGLTSHILVGTQDPYRYAEDSDWPTTLTSPAYLLQYGNGIAGVREAKLRVILSMNSGELAADYPYKATIQVKFIKGEDPEDQLEDKDPYDVFMDRVSIIPRNSLLMLVSQDDTTRMADYHMLVHHDDIFYNVPNHSNDEILRAELDDDDSRKNDERLDPPNNPAKTFLDYLYVYEGSTAFKINEQSDRFQTYDWDHPINPIDELLYNFRKNQVDLNCLKPWNTYITQTEDPSEANLREVGMEVVQATNCKVKESYTESYNKSLPLANLMIDSPAEDLPSIFDSGEDADSVDEARVIKKLITDGYRLHCWEAGSGSKAAYQVFSVTEDGQSLADVFEDILKIYACYQKVDDDSERGYHFDLFFNIQNLFKPPFEYISSVTNQPAPLILNDSYLYLSGDGNAEQRTRSGKLTLYAQMKFLVNDITASIKTIPLITYDIYNISDDKPKFFIKKLNEIPLSATKKPIINIKFEDVWIDAPTDIVNGVSTFRDDVAITQKVSILYNNNLENDHNQLSTLNFTIVHSDTGSNIPDADARPAIDVEETKKFLDITNTSGEFRAQYYPSRYNPDYQSFSRKTVNSYPVSYTYQDHGFTNEEMYLRWVFPRGTDIIGLYKKFNCLTSVNAVNARAVLKSGKDATVVSYPGRIYVRSITDGNYYLGREHGRNMNKLGYILNNVGSQTRKILMGKKG